MEFYLFRSVPKHSLSLSWSLPGYPGRGSDPQQEGATRLKIGACVLSSCVSNRLTVITNKSRMSVAEPSRGSSRTHLIQRHRVLLLCCPTILGCGGGGGSQRSLPAPLYQSFSALALLTFGRMTLGSEGCPVPGEIFSNIPGLYPVVSAAPLPVPPPSCNYRKWLQTLSHVRWGGSSSPFFCQLADRGTWELEGLLGMLFLWGVF